MAFATRQLNLINLIYFLLKYLWISGLLCRNGYEIQYAVVLYNSKKCSIAIY